MMGHVAREGPQNTEFPWPLVEQTPQLHLGWLLAAKPWLKQKHGDDDDDDFSSCFSSSPLSFFPFFSSSETSSSEGCFDEIVEGKAHLITNPKPREEILEDKKRKADKTTSYQHKNSKGVHVPSMCSR